MQKDDCNESRSGGVRESAHNLAWLTSEIRKSGVELGINSGFI